MTALPDVLGVRLYSSAQAAAIIRGEDDDPDGLKITASTLDALARSGEVECTMIGRKRGWTVEQIRAAVAHCATRAAEGAKGSAADRGRDRTPPTPERETSSIAPFRTKRGSRYAAAR